MAKRRNRKHFIIYNNGGVISITTPKDWARAHRNYFPNYNFLDHTPTTNEIENVLINNLEYSRLSNDEIVVCYLYVEINS